MVAVLDEAVGNVTSYLKENNLWDNTLLIFTTDNGGQAYAGASNLPYRGNKHGYWEGGIKVKYELYLLGGFFSWGISYRDKSLLQKRSHKHSQILNFK